MTKLWQVLHVTLSVYLTASLGGTLPCTSLDGPYCKIVNNEIKPAADEDGTLYESAQSPRPPHFSHQEGVIERSQDCTFKRLKNTWYDFIEGKDLTPHRFAKTVSECESWCCKTPRCKSYVSDSLVVQRSFP
jgi:hypothetical protein